jgi:FxLD family lantipeptide
MSVQPSGAATALLDPAADDDEFALDVRVVLSYLPGPSMGDCPTNDGCGETCKDDASACQSVANNVF